MGEKILLGLLGGGNLILFAKFLIERHDRKQERKEDKQERKEEKELENIKKELVLLKKDGLRTQLLFLIVMQPDEETEILKLAEHYFVKLKGNWYMTSMFSKWCKTRGLRPEWFDFPE